MSLKDGLMRQCWPAILPMSGSPTSNTEKTQKQGKFITPSRPTGRWSITDEVNLLAIYTLLQSNDKLTHATK